MPGLAAVVWPQRFLTREKFGIRMVRQVPVGAETQPAAADKRDSPKRILSPGAKLRERDIICVQFLS